MGIPLRIVAGPPDDRPGDPGTMWRYPPGDEAGRECWWIVLPNTKPDPGGYKEISWRTTDHASAPPHGTWDVSGAPPLLTVTPSIDIQCWRADGVRDGSYWHGFITNGELIA